MIDCVDLFCGAGGLTHGLIRAGIRVVAGIDLDEDCRFPFEANNTTRFIARDIRAISGQDVRRLFVRGRRSLVAGCAPCQPFSTYSRKSRRVREDAKWVLVEDFARIVRGAAPDFVTMENVPQILDHSVFSRFLRTLAGYHVQWQVIECAEFGIPQTRKRLVLLASRFGPIEPLSSDAAGHGGKTVRDAIAMLPSIEAGGYHPTDRLHVACSLSALNMRRVRASKPGGTWRDWCPSLRAQCHRRKTGETYPSVYGRMEWDAPAPTITTQCFGFGNGRFGHPEQDRAISLREAALLQTFPPSYRFLKDGEVPRFNVLGRLIGNAVPVRLGELIGRALIKHLRLARA